MGRWSRYQVVTAASIALIAVVFGVAVYLQRWMCDDGLIYVRIVRQILDGNGPVFNVAERVEGSTSVLWPWLVAGLTLASRIDPAYVAIALGWVSAVAAMLVVMDACRRWHRARGSLAPMIPLGALVPCGTYAMIEHSTSGLETPLALLWIACAWWLLVGLRNGVTSRRQQDVAAVVLGLGPLVRPDYGVISAVFLVTAWFLVRPSLRGTVRLAVFAIALALAFEIFRAGYYGMLVPNPALTKSATHAEWDRGIAYFVDFIRPYRMWRIAPLFIVLAIIYRRYFTRRDALLVAAPLVAALLLGLYVVRVGGDFMHGRLFVGPAFLALAPAALVPARRWTAIAAALVTVWSVYNLVHLGDGKPHTRVGDERLGYILFTGDPHPIDPALFVRVAFRPERLADATEKGLVLAESGAVMQPAPGLPTPILVAGRLGAGGAAVGTDKHVIDTLGLVHPLGSRITMTSVDEVPGHQKTLPWAWIIAEYADPAVFDQGLFGTTSEQVRAARRALECGELAELRAAVREPLTVRRFLANLTGAVRRTRLVIPHDPIDAERVLCR